MGALTTMRRRRARQGTDLVGADERLAHIEVLKPEICSLDCGTLNFGNSAYPSESLKRNSLSETCG